MNIIHPFGGKQIKLNTEFAGKKLEFETGQMAFRADGAVTVRYGDTVILATAVVAPKPKPETDFFPLLIDYEERMYASGKISGSRFMKREGRPSDQAILTSRLIDRPIRPLFPKGFRNDVQVMVTVLSADLVHEPDVIAVIAASTALMLTGVPFDGPVAAARIGQIDGKLVVNPTVQEQEKSDLNLTVAGTGDAIMMVEAAAVEADENVVTKGLDLALKSWQPVIKLQQELATKMDIKPMEYEVFDKNDEVYDKISKFLEADLGDSIRHENKQVRHEAIAELEAKVLQEFGTLPEEVQDDGKQRYSHNDISVAFEKLIDTEVRKAILSDGLRPDNRKTTEVRPISTAVSVLPRTHGSALFTRGTTQGLSVTTLGSVSDAQLVDTMEEDTTKRYMHHYNFPPYSTGEARPVRSTGRREVGHGYLAEKALLPVLPTVEDFPYTIRVVSEMLSSAGSTSMAAVCGSTLTLMDAGVPIKEPVSGVAMGLMIDHENPKKYVILTDIQDAEDFAGDMDFKVAGTKKGITALQMDIKVKGISSEIMSKALEQAKEGRMHIMTEMLKAIAKPRDEVSQYAPRITKISINPEKIREVIGKGGETIQKITAETGVEIDIEDSGLVLIYSEDESKANAAKEWIESITAEAEIGKTYKGKVIRVMDFGAFVEIMPGQEGLVHISQFSDTHVENIHDVVKEGDEFMVKLTEIDDKGRLNLSKKQAENG
ncbi:MAG: polyribonucleotide nucleotidyltransferase [Patescibacteria group bacterium]|jgi:polyribonucleotide nucleotidyltransferase|nr:polyribonucleotide nucleotidyltransferase [Patescibacteria group bacterium]